METKDYFESTLYKVFNLGDYETTIKEVLVDAGFSDYYADYICVTTVKRSRDLVFRNANNLTNRMIHCCDY
jgi:hypothetical protein